MKSVQEQWEQWCLLLGHHIQMTLHCGDWTLSRYGTSHGTSNLTVARALEPLQQQCKHDLAELQYHRPGPTGAGAHDLACYACSAPWPCRWILHTAQVHGLSEPVLDPPPPEPKPETRWDEETEKTLTMLITTARSPTEKAQGILNYLAGMDLLRPPAEETE